MKIWSVSSRKADYTWESWLEAYWEVDLDPISDQFTPEEKTAVELLELWVEKVNSLYPNGLVPIHWYVIGDGQCEYMPFQFTPDQNPTDFLTYNSWPVEPASGERLNWFDLPVADKLWQPGRSDKGGFIQQATRWKPAVLQPFVYFPALLLASSLTECELSE